MPESFDLNSTNKILDNLFDIKQINCPLSPVKLNEIEIYTMPFIEIDSKKYTPLFSDISNLGKIYLAKELYEFLKLYFYSYRNVSLYLNPSIKNNFQCEITAPEIILISGALENKIKNIGSAKEALNSSYFNIAAYLFLKESDLKGLSYSFINLSLYDEALELIEKMPKTDERLLLETTAYRNKGEIKKAGESLVLIKSESLKEKKYIEYAWLLYKSGKLSEANNIFSKLNNSENAQECFYGNALCILADKENIKSNINSIIEKLNKAIELQGPYTISSLTILGNIYFNMGKYKEALLIYERIFKINSSLYMLSLTGVCLAKINEQQRAYDIAFFSGAFNQNFAEKIFSELDKNLIKAMKYGGNDIVIKEDTKFTDTGLTEDKNKQVSLEPADISKTNPPMSQKKDDSLNFSDLKSKHNISQKDFLFRGLKLLERFQDKYNKTLALDMNLLTEMEKELRIYFLQKNVNSLDVLEKIRDNGALLSLIVKENFNSKFVEIKNIDEWAWPSIIEKKDRRIFTYPIARLWQIIWNKNSLPSQGWITKYFLYLMDIDSEKINPKSGIEAIKTKMMSHIERLFDANIEHKKMMEICSLYKETSDIEISQKGVLQIEKRIKDNFKDKTNITANKWKKLRCYGHILSEIIIKDTNAKWFNVEGDDGLWSMELSQKTYIFPIGKIYKSAILGENLSDYYDKIKSVK